MTGTDAGADHESAWHNATIFAELLRSEFGDRALRVAELQWEAASGEAAMIWKRIIDRLDPSDRPA